MKQISFNVDEKPLGQNQVYKRSNRGGLYMTPEGHQFKDLIGWCAMQAMRGLSFFTRPKVSITYYFSDNRKHDLDGPLKLSLDALNGVCWEDDSCVKELHLYKEKGTPMIKFHIIEY